MIGQGRATEAEAAWFLSKLDDPEFYTTGQTQFATRGRKPQMSNTPERHLST